MSAPLDLPEIVAEVAEVFAAYEAALRANDLSTLNAFFLQSAATVRLGIAEHAFGIRSVIAQRARLPQISPLRQLHNTVITTVGRDAAAVSTEFSTPDSASVGRQSQTWVRTPAGWKIVAAHVSVLDAPFERCFDTAAPVRRKRE